MLYGFSVMSSRKAEHQNYSTDGEDPTRSHLSFRMDEFMSWTQVKKFIMNASTRMFLPSRVDH